MRWRGQTCDARLAEALQFLKGPDFLPAESAPAAVEFYPDQTGRHFRFPTPRPCAAVENNVVYGRLHRCGERWRERPTIILLPGGGGFPDYRFVFPRVPRHCQRAGFNAATLVAPWHFQRRPPRLRRLNFLREWTETVADGACNFPGLGSLDFLGWATAAAQAVAEIRALTGWLLGQGCPAVALWGISYGGWLAGLVAGCDARLGPVVLTVPGVRTNLPLAQLIFWRGIRDAMQGQCAAYEALNRTRWNLTLTRPVIPKENLLLIEASHDLLAPKEAIEDLWQAWGQPDRWRWPHGHVSWMGVPGLKNRVLRWLSPRLEAPGVRRGQTRVQPH